MINVILSLAFILLLGFASSKFIRKIKLPTVTAYILLGVVLGPHISNLVSLKIISVSGLISNLVLGFIAFSLGQNFLLAHFRKIGKPVLWISVFEACGAWILVTSAFYFLLKQPLHISLLFGAIASATAPAATMMVVREHKAKGSFTDTLLGVVAIDDAWCLIIFAVSLAFAKAVGLHQAFNNHYFLKVIFNVGFDVLGAFILGGVLAWALSYFSLFARNQTELLICTLGVIFLNTGIAMHLNFSVLLANMFLGAVLVNVNKTSFKFFDILRRVDSPLYLLFFVLAGANFEIHLLPAIGLLGITYLVFRVLGKVGGAFLGGYLGRTSARIYNNMGWALVPQAGVALGAALIAKDAFPSIIGTTIFSTIAATTIIYELVGPLLTKFALMKAGEI